MSKVLKWILGLVCVVAVTGILVWAFILGRKEAATEAEREQPVKAASRVATQNAQTIVTLDAAAQTRSGIEVANVKAVSQREELRATAVVLSVQDLTTLRNNYLIAASQVEKAKAALDVSSEEYKRLKELYQDNQNASAKALQGAEGTWRSDETSLKAARDSLALNENLVRQAWGRVLASWLISGSPIFDRILAQEDSLLQVSMPPGSTGDPPGAASVQLPDGKKQPAKFVSPFPRVDPRIQSPPYLYITPTRGGITPGMTLVLSLSEGSLTRGVVVPSRAVVWWQEKAWAYVEISPGRFTRREVPTDVPVSGGWFATRGFAPGDRVVTSGSQQLLSEELRSQIQMLGEGEEGEKD